MSCWHNFKRDTRTRRALGYIPEELLPAEKLVKYSKYIDIYYLIGVN